MIVDKAVDDVDNICEHMGKTRYGKLSVMVKFVEKGGKNSDNVSISASPKTGIDRRREIWYHLSCCKRNTLV